MMAIEFENINNSLNILKNSYFLHYVTDNLIRFLISIQVI